VHSTSGISNIKYLLLVLCGEVLCDAEESIEGGTATTNVVPGIIHRQKHRARAQETFALTNVQLCIKLRY
jgi:predicted RecA/RadA family phage recombinase